MKIFLLTLVVLAICGVANAHAAQEREITLESPLIQEDWRLYGVTDITKAEPPKAYLLAKHEEQTLTIETAEDFAQIVTAVEDRADALQLVRLLTSQEIRPFLADINYHEVQRKAAASAGEDAPQQWFALDPEDYDRWHLYDPVVSKQESLYQIERFVAAYPRIKDQTLTPAKLLKIVEQVDAEGHYTMDIQQEIAEGEAIQNILLFTK